MEFTKCEAEVMTCFCRVGRDLTPEDVWAGVFILHEKDRDIHMIIKNLERLVRKGFVEKYFDGDAWLYRSLVGQDEVINAFFPTYKEIFEKARKRSIIIRKEIVP